MGAVGAVRRILFGAVLAGCLGLAPAALATIRYAEPLGDGPEPCEQSNPCDIQRAVEGDAPADVTTGDEIVLLPGTYTAGNDGAAEVQISDAIDVHGSGEPAPSLYTGSSTGVSVNNSAATLSDLTIQHSGGAFALQMNAGTIERVYVRTFGTAAATACAIGGGTVRDSVCLNHRTNGGDALHYDITGVTTRSSVLRNVTAVSTAPGSYGGRYASDGGATVTVDAKNVIFAGVAGDLRVDATAGSTAVATVDHSNYDDAVGTGTFPPAGSPTNQTAAPLFVDRIAGDLHQLASSPTVDAGTSDPGLGSADLDGDARSLGAAPDIGADELIPPPGEPPVAPDLTAPETTIDQAPKSKSRKRKATIAFSSNEPGSSFECRFDQAGFAPCVSPVKRKVKLGKRRFEVRATDPAGNVDTTPALAKWKVKRRK